MTTSPGPRGNWSLRAEDLNHEPGPSRVGIGGTTDSRSNSWPP